jgi:MATE family multidrug resistance protein
MIEKEKGTVQTPEVSYPPLTSINEQIPAKKQRLIPSFLAGLQDFVYGASYKAIFGYFWPELISALMLQSALPIIDSLLIAELKSTSTYATLSVSSHFIHFMGKFAEGLATGSAILSGQYNGLGNHKAAGRAMRDSFWLTILMGGVLATLIFFGSSWIYWFYGVPFKMMEIGTPFLRLRAIGIFFTFIYLALIGFMRSIKNTHVPMKIYLVGGIVFLFFDYALIHGNFGFPTLGIQGSAIASIIYYGFMSIIALCYITWHRDMKPYSISLMSSIIDWSNVKRILHLSWPSILDKATFAGSYIWLGMIVAPMGKYAIASYGVIKDLERFAFLPAVAFAQVVTFLVSNAYSMQDWQGIKSSIKKILFLAVAMVFSILCFFWLFAEKIIAFFDHKGKFTHFAIEALPIISMLAFFDVLQIILSGALRGAANVKTVMAVRLALCVGFFIPLSYVLSGLAIETLSTKFILVYGSFYIASAFMSVAYIYRFRTEGWKGKII